MFLELKEPVSITYATSNRSWILSCLSWDYQWMYFGFFGYECCRLTVFFSSHFYITLVILSFNNLFIVDFYGNGIELDITPGQMWTTYKMKVLPVGFAIPDIDKEMDAFRFEGRLKINFVLLNSWLIFKFNSIVCQWFWWWGSVPDVIIFSSTELKWALFVVRNNFFVALMAPTQ